MILNGFSKQQRFVAGLIGLCMVGLAGWLLLKPSGKSTGELRREVEELQQKLASADEIILRKDLIEAELAKSIKDLSEMEAHLPLVSDRYAWAFEFISRCAGEAGVMVDSVREAPPPEAAKADKGPRPYEMNLTMSCGYNRLVHFMWCLKTGNPLLIIKELTVNPIPDNLDKQSVRMVIGWPAAFEVKRVGN